MTRQLVYDVICDGGTDRALLPIINWAIHRLDPDVEILEPDFRKRKGPVREFLESYESGAMLLFVHRDSEAASLGNRLQEFGRPMLPRVVPIVPVRMTEAWLLIDAAAIAQAADAPGQLISLPALGTLESLSDPKAELERLLLEAAGNPTGRRRDKFRRHIASRRVNVASLIPDFSPLEQLSAFKAFQTALRARYPYGAQR